MSVPTEIAGSAVSVETHLWLVRRAARTIRALVADGANTSEQMVRCLTNADPGQLVRADFVVPLDEGERAVLVIDLSPRPAHIGDAEQRLAHELGRPCGLFDCRSCRQETDRP